MTRNIRTEGIVLNEFKYMEKSKILRIFTKDFGKISVMARGAFGAKSPLVAVTQLFGENSYELYTGSNFYYISGSKVINSNFNIRTDYEKLILGSFLLELVDKAFPSDEPNEKVYFLFRKTLRILSKTDKDVYVLIIAFELKLMAFLGYRPILDKKLKNAVFSVSNGGTVEKSSLNIGVYYDISNEDIYYLYNLLYTSLDTLNTDIKRERLLYLQKIILEYIKYNLEINEIKSLKLI